MGKKIVGYEVTGGLNIAVRSVSAQTLMPNLSRLLILLGNHFNQIIEKTPSKSERLILKETEENFWGIEILGCGANGLF